MLNRFRFFLFLFFSCSFLVIAASVLFYAYGYRFSFERGIFIYTGSLSLKTNIETVSIKIDNELIPEKRLGLLNNSIHIAGLNPGEHFIQVSAPGYRPWEKKVVVTSGLTTEFWNIYLIEENYTREAVPETARTLRMFPAPNGLFATVKRDDSRYSVDVLDIGGENNTEVFTTSDAVFLPSLETNLEWSPESHKIIVPLIRDTQPFFVVVDIKNETSFPLNEKAQVAAPLRAPRWDATTKDFLFFLSNDALYRFDTRSEEPAKLVAEHVAAYDLSGSKLYYLGSETGMVYEINGNGNDDSPSAITTAPVTIDQSGLYSLIVYDDTRLSIIEEGTGRLFVYNERAEKPLKELGSGVESIQYSDDGKKLLYYTQNEISVYFNQDWEAQPFRAQDSVAQVARFSSPIRNVQWAEDYEHVIFSLGKSIKMIELDNRDRRDLSDLLTLDTPPLQILSRFGADTLYVISETPLDDLGHTVFSIEMPQYATFFGL